MPSAARAAASRQRDDQPGVPAHPVMHLIQVKGDDAAADQVEQVAEPILLFVPLHQRGSRSQWSPIVMATCAAAATAMTRP